MIVGKNHIHALATAFASLGGFQEQPKWFKSMKHSYIWQIICLSILIYQGGGNLDFMYSLSLAVLFFTVMHFSNYLEIDFIKIETDSSEEDGITNSESEEVEEVEEVLDNTQAENDNEVEAFFGYPTY